jgi:acyltransferase
MEIGKRYGNRIEWVDIAKGIGIILVIVGHTSIEFSWLGKFIYSFHMPLFFFLSGYFASHGQYATIAAFIKRKSSALLIPYFIFAFISYLYFLFRYQYGDPAYFKDISVYQEFFGIFYSSGTTEWMDFNLPLWFLTCLFIVEALFFFIGKVFHKKSYIMLVLMICSVIGYLDGVFHPYKLPWGIDVALTAVVFYGIGNLSRTPVTFLISKALPVKFLLVFCLFSVNVLFLTTVNLNSKIHGHYFDFYIAALSGIACCILLSSLIHSRMLIFFGKNTLILLALHMPFLNLVAKLTSYFGIAQHSYAKEVMNVIVTLLVLVPVIYSINKYTPFILGKKMKRTHQSLQAT